MKRATPRAPARARRGLRRTSLLLLLSASLAIGCRSIPRVLDPEDRKLAAPPLSHVRDATDDDPSPDKDQGDNDPKDGNENGNGDDPEPETWPNMEDPGPDMANFPNGAFTIPRGAFQVELAPISLGGPTDNNGPNYTTQFLLRYGLTDRVELRLFGIGYVAVYNTPQRTTGFAPPAFDMKMNLWDESENHLIPAVGLEVYIQSTFGSPALRSGVQPAMSLLFDHTLPFGFEFEWNVGLNGAQKPLFSNDSPNGPINLVHGPE